MFFCGVQRDGAFARCFFVLEALQSQMPSDSYWAAVGTGNGLNLGQGSSSVLTNSQFDPLAQYW